MNRAISHGILAALMLTAASASAQIGQLPPRPTRPPFGGGQPADPNQIRHDLTFGATLLGGYEDNIAPLGPQPPGAVLRPSTSIGMGDLSLRYAVGTGQRGLDVTGRGSADYASTYRRAGLPPNYGGDVTISGRTALGQDTHVGVFQRVQVSPYASLGLFGGLNGGVLGGISAGLGMGGVVLPGPDTNMANALFEGQMWGTVTTALVDRKWGRRTNTIVSYSFDRQAHKDRSLLDDRTHTGSLTVSRRVGRTGSVRASYRPSITEAVQRGLQGSSRNHNLDLGFAMTRRISRSRTLMLSAGGGGSLVDERDQVRQEYWLPTAYGDVSLDLGRSWTAAAEWRQAANGVPSTVFSPNRFLSRSLFVSLGGYVNDRVELVFSGGSSTGVVAGQLAGREGSYSAYTGSAQLRVGLTPWWSAIVGVNHYQARLNGSAAEALQTSPHLHRNSVRVGFGWSLPLLGGIERRPRARERN